MRQVLTIAAVCCGLATPLSADVTISGTTAGKGMTPMDGTTVSYIKGMKMRNDSTMRGELHTTIFDVDAQKMILINHKGKEADVLDFATFAADLKGVTASDIEVGLTPTARTKQVLGKTCTEYDVRVAVKAPLANNPLTIVMTGPACIAKDMPGQADYAAFYRGAVDKGFIFMDPRAAKGQPGQAKGMAQMYKAMADAGMPLSSEVKMTFEGTGPMAAMMNKMAGMSFTTTVTAVSTDTIPADTFTVPAGFKIKTK